MDRNSAGLRRGLRCRVAGPAEGRQPRRRFLRKGGGDAVPTSDARLEPARSCGQGGGLLVRRRDPLEFRTYTWSRRLFPVALPACGAPAASFAVAPATGGAGASAVARAAVAGAVLAVGAGRRLRLCGCRRPSRSPATAFAVVPVALEVPAFPPVARAPWSPAHQRAAAARSNPVRNLFLRICEVLFADTSPIALSICRRMQAALPSATMVRSTGGARTRPSYEVRAF